MKRTTVEWVSKAESDYGAVLALRRSRRRDRFDPICFHCQQCAEKYLKARLNEAGVRFPKTHDLGVLVNLVTASEPLWLGLQSRLDRLTKYAVHFRYPGTTADAADAKEAYIVCIKLRSLARPALGLKL